MNLTTKTFTRITVNGKTYSSVEEMPPEIRQQYEKAMSMLADKNHNGIPDVLEGSAVEGNGVRTVVNQKSIHLGTISARSDSSGGGGITMSLPTLLALLATVAVIAAAVVWYARQ